jgi:hypothetical protein
MMTDTNHTDRWSSYDDAMADPLFQKCRGIMGTADFGQDDALRRALNFAFAEVDASRAAPAPCEGTYAGCAPECGPHNRCRPAPAQTEPQSGEDGYVCPAGKAQAAYRQVELTDWLIMEIAGTDELTGDAILAFARRLIAQTPAAKEGDASPVLPPAFVPERREFEMTEAQLETLLAAMKPQPYILTGGLGPRSVQENANDAWRALGDELGFVWDSVLPFEGKSQRVFSAITKAKP